MRMHEIAIWNLLGFRFQHSKAQNLCYANQRTRMQFGTLRVRDFNAYKQTSCDIGNLSKQRMEV